MSLIDPSLNVSATSPTRPTASFTTCSLLSSSDNVRWMRSKMLPTYGIIMLPVTKISVIVSSTVLYRITHLFHQLSYLLQFQRMPQWFLHEVAAHSPRDQSRSKVIREWLACNGTEEMLTGSGIISPACFRTCIVDGRYGSKDPVIARAISPKHDRIEIFTVLLRVSLCRLWYSAFMKPSQYCSAFSFKALLMSPIRPTATKQSWESSVLCSAGNKNGRKALTYGWMSLSIAVSSHGQYHSQRC